MSGGLPAQRRCRQCGSAFLAIAHTQSFCRQKCRRLWHSWREARGARAIELLIRWRGSRRRGDFTAMTAFADELLREYRAREAAQRGDIAGGADQGIGGPSGGLRPDDA